MNGNCWYPVVCSEENGCDPDCCDECGVFKIGGCEINDVICFDIIYPFNGSTIDRGKSQFISISSTGYLNKLTSK